MKIGDVVQLVKISTNHGYVMGRQYIISLPYTGVTSGAYWRLTDAETNVLGSNYIAEADLSYFLNKKNLECKIRESEIEIERNKKMLEYLNDQNREEVDSVEFFAWYIVKIMESNDPKKTEKISKLINTVTNNIDVEKIITRV